MQRMARARGRGLPSGGNRVLKARWKHGANVRKLEKKKGGDNIFFWIF